MRRDDGLERWLDDDAGPVVRPYALTGGRVRPSTGGFDLVALVAGNPAPPPVRLLPEHRAILDAASEPISVAEAAARVGLSLPVLRVLLGDLLAEGLITLHEPAGLTLSPDEHVLKAVVNELRAH